MRSRSSGCSPGPPRRACNSIRSTWRTQPDLPAGQRLLGRHPLLLQPGERARRGAAGVPVHCRRERRRSGAHRGYSRVGGAVVGRLKRAAGGRVRSLLVRRSVLGRFRCEFQTQAPALARNHRSRPVRRSGGGRTDGRGVSPSQYEGDEEGQAGDRGRRRREWRGWREVARMATKRCQRGDRSDLHRSRS